MKMWIAILILTGCWIATANADNDKVAWNRALGDAARQTVAALSGDARLEDIGRIAFVRVNAPDGVWTFAQDADVSQVFEATLLSVPSRFAWVTHASHEQDWTLIDGVFDQAADFTDYDPATHPELQKLALADALLLAQVVGADQAEKVEETSRKVQLALRLIRVRTGEVAWGDVVEGQDVETHTRADALTEEAKSWLTWRNIGIAAGVLVLLVLFRMFVKAATRVR